MTDPKPRRSWQTMPGLLAGACSLAVCLCLPVSAGLPHADELPFFKSGSTLDDATWYASDGWTNGEHQSCEWRASALTEDAGNLKMTLSDKGGKVRPLGCAEMHTLDTKAYGLYSTRMKTAAGSGLNTAFFTYIGPPTGSPQHDEIDFEFLGKDSHTVQLNWFTDGKGGHEKIIDLGFDAAAAFHDYAFEWKPGRITWFVDGKKVYETPDGADLPVTPGRIYLSLWSGAPINADWLGPFAYHGPVSAEAAWAKFTPDDFKHKP